MGLEPTGETREDLIDILVLGIGGEDLRGCGKVRRPGNFVAFVPDAGLVPAAVIGGADKRRSRWHIQISRL
jgi:hypothetical protein